MTIKTLTSLVLAGALALGGTGCSKVEEPIKEDYFNQETILAIHGIEIPFFRDLDNDGKIDAVSDARINLNLPLYLFEGYEKYFEGYEIIRAKKMNPQMREAATKIAKGINEFNYEKAMARYEESKKGDN